MGVTIYDIAEKAAVSIATVSRVFSDHPRVSESTRTRVKAVAEEMGYQPDVSARSLASRKTHLISALIPVMTNYFFVEVLRGLQDRLSKSEFDLIVFTSNALEDVDVQLERVLQRGRAVGAILFSMPITETRVKRLRRSRQPIILIDCFHPNFDSVSMNNELGGYLATQHLIQQGHRRIGMVMAGKGVPAAERRKGYERALQEAELESSDALVVASLDVKEHGYTEQAGHDAMQDLLQRSPLPTAVFATSDIQALGAMRAIQEAGLRIPDDIAIVGFDDIVVSQYVGLTTLRQPMRQMGALAVDKFLLRLANPEHPISHTVFAPQLVVRTTSGGTPNTAFSTRASVGEHP